MAITKRTRAYEILVRYQPDGTVVAHRQDITEIVEGSTILSATLGDPYPLASKDVAEVAGDFLPALIAERDAATAAKAIAEAERDAAVFAKEAAEQSAKAAVAEAEVDAPE